MEVRISENSLKNEFSGRKVFITGNTGFKGSWLTFWLLQLGAEVAGYSNKERTTPSMYEELGLSDRIKQFTGDISDFNSVKTSIEEFRPDFIFHLAAQSIVSKSIESPLVTFQTNTLGTVTLLEAIRVTEYKGIAVLITSDKCYENDERQTGYSENDVMGGKDPYSASKGAAEIAISAYFRTFFTEKHEAKIGIGRAGNVIGGGDWNENRIVVDCIKAWQSGTPVSLRNPESTRPWQHVLEPLSGYLQLALHLSQDRIKTGEAFNFGPRSGQVFTVNEIVQQLAKSWPDCPGVENSSPSKISNTAEAKLLSLNCEKAKSQLGWESTLEIADCVSLIADWYLVHGSKGDLQEVTARQISYFQSKIEKSIA
jgi:CDP-glucose 4,6-dehydratase